MPGEKSQKPRKDARSASMKAKKAKAPSHSEQWKHTSKEQQPKHKM